MREDQIRFIEDMNAESYKKSDDAPTIRTILKVPAQSDNDSIIKQLLGGKVDTNKITNIHPEDTKEQAEQKVKRTALKVHPDKSPTNKEKAGQAFKILMSATKRIQETQEESKSWWGRIKYAIKTNTMPSELRDSVPNKSSRMTTADRMRSSHLTACSGERVRSANERFSLIESFEPEPVAAAKRKASMTPDDVEA